MEIWLDLSRHCIETQAKKLYEKELSGYFKADPEKRAGCEQCIELLKDFLQGVDFGDLRTRHPALAGHSPEKALLKRGQPGKGFVVIVAGLEIAPKEKK